MKVSYLLPIRISKQHNQLKVTVDEIANLIENKKIEFESEESSVDFVDLDSDQFEHENEYLEDNRDILNGITQTLFSSLFVSIYSHLETNLSALIKEIELSTKNKIKSKHLKRDGSYINCCLTYLKLVQNLDLNSFTETIIYLNDITNVRNVFTHSRGILPRETSKLKTSIFRFVKENEGVEINNNLIIITNGKFIENVIIANNKFLLRLINHINEN
jgi:hypothetical protein